jgi:hypothetical protein
MLRAELNQAKERIEQLEREARTVPQPETVNVVSPKE